MSKSSKFVTLIMVIVLLLVATAPAFADEPPPVVTREVYNGPIDQWTLPANSCPTVPLGLTGDGQRRTVTVTRTYDDGHVVVTVRDVVRGSAWNLAGNYRYLYINHSIEERPAAPGPIQVTMGDSFIVTGNRNVDLMNVGFFWRWTYTPPADQWPPVDNWERIIEHGDPLNCDPI